MEIIVKCHTKSTKPGNGNALEWWEKNIINFIFICERTYCAGRFKCITIAITQIPLKQMKWHRIMAIWIFLLNTELNGKKMKCNSWWFSSQHSVHILISATNNATFNSFGDFDFIVHIAMLNTSTLKEHNYNEWLGHIYAFSRLQTISPSQNKSQPFGKHGIHM